MDLLEFEILITTSGVPVKCKTISFDGYEYLFKKKHKKLTMKPKNTCPENVFIFFKEFDTTTSVDFTYRDVKCFTKNGLYYDIESHKWIEFYDIETQNLFIQYISKYYIQPTIKQPFNTTHLIDCLCLISKNRRKHTKEELEKINEKYREEYSEEYKKQKFTSCKYKKVTFA